MESVAPLTPCLPLAHMQHWTGPNYSAYHKLGPPCEIRNHSFHSPSTAYPARSQTVLEDKLQKLSCSQHTTKAHICSSGETQPTSQMRKTEARRGEVPTPMIKFNKWAEWGELRTQTHDCLTQILQAPWWYSPWLRFPEGMWYFSHSLCAPALLQNSLMRFSKPHMV